MSETSGQKPPETVRQLDLPDTCKAKQAIVKQADTREQLEADVRGAVHGAYAYEDYIPEDMIIGWLDRQAAITEREVKERVNFSLIAQTANALFPDYQERIDELTAEREQYRDNMLAQTRIVAELTAERDKLQAEYDKMAGGDGQ